MNVCLLLLPADRALVRLLPPAPTEVGTRARAGGRDPDLEAAAIVGRVGRAPAVALGIGTTEAGGITTGPAGTTALAAATVMIAMAASNFPF